MDQFFANLRPRCFSPRTSRVQTLKLDAVARARSYAAYLVVDQLLDPKAVKMLVKHLSEYLHY